MGAFLHALHTFVHALEREKKVQCKYRAGHVYIRRLHAISTAHDVC